MRPASFLCPPAGRVARGVEVLNKLNKPRQGACDGRMGPAVPAAVSGAGRPGTGAGSSGQKKPGPEAGGGRSAETPRAEGAAPWAGSARTTATAGRPGTRS